jgi:hypothetical protein
MTGGKMQHRRRLGPSRCTLRRGFATACWRERGGGKGMAYLASKTRCCTGVSLTSSNIPTPILVTTNNQERGPLFPLFASDPLSPQPLAPLERALFSLSRLPKKCGERQRVSFSYRRRRPSLPSPPYRLSGEELPLLDLCMPGEAKSLRFRAQSCLEIVVTCIHASVLKHPRRKREGWRNDLS